MLDFQRFETLLESLAEKIDELPNGTVKNNLASNYECLYQIFEEALALDVDFDKIQREHKFLMEFLSEHLSYQDKLHIRIVHGIYIS